VVESFDIGILGPLARLKMDIDSKSSITQLAVDYPLSIRVFARQGIDFCCDENRSLEEVCVEKGLDCKALLAEIRSELQATDVCIKHWVKAPLLELVEHILATYHQPLGEELLRLDSMARKVSEVHGADDASQLMELAVVVHRLRVELDHHMRKEERYFLSLVESGAGGMPKGPISAMLDEHLSTAETLFWLRKQTNGYRVPQGACITWRTLWEGLASLEESLHQHMYLENNILFPRMLL